MNTRWPRAERVDDVARLQGERRLYGRPASLGERPLDRGGSPAAGLGRRTGDLGHQLSRRRVLELAAQPLVDSIAPSNGQG